MGVPSLASGGELRGLWTRRFVAGCLLGSNTPCTSIFDHNCIISIQNRDFWPRRDPCCVTLDFRNFTFGAPRRGRRSRAAQSQMYTNVMNSLAAAATVQFFEFGRVGCEVRHGHWALTPFENHSLRARSGKVCYCQGVARIGTVTGSSGRGRKFRAIQGNAQQATLSLFSAAGLLSSA